MLGICRAALASSRLSAKGDQGKLQNANRKVKMKAGSENLQFSLCNLQFEFILHVLWKSPITDLQERR
jgi:hypothetical protein